MLKDLISHYRGELQDHTELRAQVNRNRGVALVGGNLVSNSRSEQSGVSARMYKNGVYGFASSAEYSDEIIREVLRAAEENAFFLSSRVKKNRGPLPPLKEGTIKLDREVKDTEQKRYIEFARELDSYIAEKYPKLASRSINVRCDSMEASGCQ